MKELIKKAEEYLKKVGDQGLDSVDKLELFQIVDIYKDLKEVENMNNYGRYEGYGDNYGTEYNNRGYGEYGRRGVDSRYRASRYMDAMRGSYETYEDDRNEYNNGNYGAKEDGLKDLESMLHYNHKLLKYIKETATSPEEQEIVKKHFMKFKEIMNV